MKTHLKLIAMTMLGFTTFVSAQAMPENTVYQCQVDSDDVFVEGKELSLKYRLRQAHVKLYLRINESSKVTIGNGAGQPYLDTQVDGKQNGTSFEKGDLRFSQDADEFSSYDATDPLARITGLSFQGFKPLPRLNGYPQEYRGRLFFVHEQLEDFNAKKVIYRETHDATAICSKIGRT